MGGRAEVTHLMSIPQEPEIPSENPPQHPPSPGGPTDTPPEDPNAPDLHAPGTGDAPFRLPRDPDAETTI